MIGTTDPAKYLDRILEILSEDFGNSMTLQQIQNKLTPIEMFGEVGDVQFAQDLLTDLKYALSYLSSNNLIYYYQDNTVRLSFEGYMKIKKRSFSKEFKEKSTNQLLQRIAWVIPILISIIALIISIYKVRALPCIEEKSPILSTKISK